MIYLDNPPAKVRIRARLLGKTLMVGNYESKETADRVVENLRPELEAIEAQALESFREAVKRASNPVEDVVQAPRKIRRKPDEPPICHLNDDATQALAPNGYFFDLDNFNSTYDAENDPDWLYWRNSNGEIWFKTPYSLDNN